MAQTSHAQHIVPPTDRVVSEKIVHGAREVYHGPTRLAIFCLNFVRRQRLVIAAREGPPYLAKASGGRMPLQVIWVLFVGGLSAVFRRVLPSL